MATRGEFGRRQRGCHFREATSDGAKTYGKPATTSEQEQRIREYLGYRAFDAKAQEQ